MKERIARRSRWDGPGGDLAQERLEFAERHLDRVKVGGILRQISKGCARRLDRFVHAGDFMGSKIINHHDIVSLQCWHDALFDLGAEHFSGHRSVDHHRCHHLVMTKRRYESDRLPGPLRHVINHPVAAWSERLFVPAGTDGPATLGALMERYPLVRIAEQPAA